MDIGATFTPATYSQFFRELTTMPAFCRVFFKPGDGLRPLRDPAIANLPGGTLPWISHRDRVPADRLTAYWGQLAKLYPDRKIRWTFHHEAAPMGDTDRLDYLEYWNEVLLPTAEDFPNTIEPVQIQTNYAMRWRDDTDWRAWIIHEVALGFDCYPLAHYRYEPPESMFGVLLAAVGEFGIPHWGVPELGADIRVGQDRGAWLEECVTYLAEREADFVGLWGAGGGNYAPTDEPTLNAFRAIIGS